MNAFTNRMIMWKQGASDKEIAEAEGISAHAVVGWRKRHGLACNYVSKPKTKEKKLTETVKVARKDTICWGCQNACGRCPWSEKHAKPVNGWDAISTKVKMFSTRNGNSVGNMVNSFIVLACPLYVPDPPRMEVVY